MENMFKILVGKKRHGKQTFVLTAMNLLQNKSRTVGRRVVCNLLVGVLTDRCR